MEVELSLDREEHVLPGHKAEPAVMELGAGQHEEALAPALSEVQPAVNGEAPCCGAEAYQAAAAFVEP